MQWVSKAEVFAAEQRRDDFVLMLAVVFRKVRQERFEVFLLCICQHLLPRRQADNLKEDLGLKKGNNNNEKKCINIFSSLSS